LVLSADNKQIAVNDLNGNPIGQYFYDGEGKRVKKVTGTETTVFVYSSGKLVAEYSTQLSSSPSINYTTTDHLGSPRIITDALGQGKSRRDFMPFGEELNASVGNRNAAGLLYSAPGDSVRQKFTGYQNDSETSLDFVRSPGSVSSARSDLFVANGDQGTMQSPVRGDLQRGILLTGPPAGATDHLQTDRP
jgi:hypothetical protein